MNRLAKGLLIVTTNLDNFSLDAIRQIHQTFYLPNFPAIQYIGINGNGDEPGLGDNENSTLRLL